MNLLFEQFNFIVFDKKNEINEENCRKIAENFP